MADIHHPKNNDNVKKESEMLKVLIESAVELIVEHQSMVHANHLSSDQLPPDTPAAVAELFRGYFHHRSLLATTLFSTFAHGTAVRPMTSMASSIESMLVDLPGVRLGLRQVTTLGVLLFMTFFQPLPVRQLTMAALNVMGASQPNIRAIIRLLKTLLGAADGGEVLDQWSTILERSFVNEKLLGAIGRHQQYMEELVVDLEKRVELGHTLVHPAKTTGTLNPY